MRWINAFSCFCLIACSFGQSPAFIDRTDDLHILVHARGVSVADFDNDGDQDFYVSTSQNTSPTGLYINQGDGSFTERAIEYGVSITDYTTMALWIDLNEDGWLDLYVGISGSKNRIFLNQSGESFEEVTSIDLDSRFRPNGMCAADLNGDGLLDIYLNNFQDKNEQLIKEGFLEYDNTAREANSDIELIPHSSIAFDYDNDLDLDLLLAFDNNSELILLENDGQGIFNNVTATRGIDFQGDGMGLNIADLNNDGFFDFYVTNLPHNALYVSDGNGGFSDIAASAGVDDPGMGWGVNFLDYDNDGLQDIYVANQSPFSTPNRPNLLYRNNGDLTFTDVADELLRSDTYDWGSASADFNQDGKVDLLIATRDGVKFFENQTSGGNWFSLDLIGNYENRYAIGARIELTHDDQKIIRQVMAGDGYYSQSGYNQHFGIGTSSQVDAIKVTWPNKETESYGPFDANERIIISQKKGALLFDKDQYRELITELPPSPIPLAADQKSDLFKILSDKLIFSKSAQRTITVYDFLGRQIDSINAHEHIVSFSHLPTGLYLFVIQTDGEIIRTRILKSP